MWKGIFLGVGLLLLAVVLTLLKTPVVFTLTTLIVFTVVTSIFAGVEAWGLKCVAGLAIAALTTMLIIGVAIMTLAIMDSAILDLLVDVPFSKFGRGSGWLLLVSALGALTGHGLRLMANGLDPETEAVENQEEEHWADVLLGRPTR